MTHTTQEKKYLSLWQALPNYPLITYLSLLRRILRGVESVLDVGCGVYSPIRFINVSRRVGLDGYAPTIQEAKLHGTHDEYVYASIDTLSELFPPRSFDAVVALDVIEHLPKEYGDIFLANLEKIAKKRVVIFTPNGFISQKSIDGDLQEHVSGWTAPEMRAKGYTVYGMYGWKKLRGGYHTLKGKPRFFWGIVSEITQYLWCFWHPESAAAILCVKDITKDDQDSSAAVIS